MIVDRLENISRYKGLYPSLDLALNYIQDHLVEMPDHVELDGDQVYGNNFTYETLPDQDCFFEAHRQFADIQIIRQGRERIAVSPVDRLTAYESHPERDFWALKGEEYFSLNLDPGLFLIVLPGDAHKLKMQVEGAEQVTKTVFKVRVC